MVSIKRHMINSKAHTHTCSLASCQYDLVLCAATIIIIITEWDQRRAISPFNDHTTPQCFMSAASLASCSSSFFWSAAKPSMPCSRQHKTAAGSRCGTLRVKLARRIGEVLLLLFPCRQPSRPFHAQHPAYRNLTSCTSPLFFLVPPPPHTHAHNTPNTHPTHPHYLLEFVNCHLVGAVQRVKHGAAEGADLAIRAAGHVW